MRKYFILILPVLLSFVIAGCVKEDDGPVWSLVAGDDCPVFSVVMNDGSVVTTASLSGKTSVIVFFDIDCEDCHRFLPRLQEAYEQSLASGSDIPFICISRGENTTERGERGEKRRENSEKGERGKLMEESGLLTQGEAVAAFWQKYGLTLPYSVQPDRKIYDLFASSIVPRVYVVSPDLKILQAICPE